MKKRLLSLVLCLVMVFSLFPAFGMSAAAAGANGITNPAPVTGDLNLTKNLTPGENGTYDINMEAWSTGKVEYTTYTEKIPTDFVVIVDQSGSMATRDMSSGDSYQKVDNVKLSDAANGEYYYQDADGNYYRVYGQRGYLYEQRSGGTVSDYVVDSYFEWLSSNDNNTEDNPNNLFYYRDENGIYHKVTVTVTYRGLLRYDVHFYCDVQDFGTYRVVGAHGTFSGNFYIFGDPTVNFTLYHRWLGYNSLSYRDANGDVITLTPNNLGGKKEAEFCDSYKNAVTSAGGSTEVRYDNLYRYTGTYETRLSSLETALNAFVEEVAKERDTFGLVDNRIAIVGFSSKNDSNNLYNNTEILSGVNIASTQSHSSFSEGSYSFPYTGANYAKAGNNGTNYNGPQFYRYTNNNGYTVQVNNTYYKAALVSAANSGSIGTVNPDLTKAIQSITAYGGTQPEDGFDMAYQIYQNRDDTKYTIRTGENKDTVVDRNKVVVFFTDGEPGNLETDNRYTEANQVVSKAYNLKHYKDPGASEESGALVFSIGVFGNTDSEPLTYRYGTTSQYASWQAESDFHFVRRSKDNNSYLFRQWIPGNAEHFGAEASDTIFDYMSVVSSNYPNAVAFMNEDYVLGNKKPNGDWVFDGDYLAATFGPTARNSDPVEKNNYYRMASNQQSLINAFKEAVTLTTEESHSSSQVKIDDTAVFRDKVNLADFDISDATYTVKWQPVKLQDGVLVNNGTAVTKVEGAELDDTGVVEATDFNYSSEDFFVTPDSPGYKLVVTISGLTPKKASGTLHSNLDTKDEDDNDLFGAGIYGKDEEKPTVQIQSPTLQFPESASKTYVIDFNAPMKVATDTTKLVGAVDNTLAGTNGNFVKSGTDVTYQLKSGNQASKTAEINKAYTDVDNATVYGKLVNVDDAVVGWSQITTVPGSSVYYSDKLTNTVTVGDGSGYNEDIDGEISKSAVRMDSDTATSALFFTFYGTGIDIYCTTHADAGYVNAAVFKADSQAGCNKDTRIADTVTVMKNYSAENRYNVPTLHFDLSDQPAQTYTVRINAVKGSQYKLDGVRVYNAVDEDLLAGTDEADASYLNLHELLLNAENGFSVENEIPAGAADIAVVNGVLFVDDAENLSMTWMENGVEVPKYATNFNAYKAVGPKNEIYLAKGQAITFMLNMDRFDKDTKLWVGLSAPEDGTGEVMINSNSVATDVTSYIDMYYPVTVPDTGSVTITNNDDALIAVTDLKITNMAEGAKLTTSSARDFLFAPMNARAIVLAANNGVDPEAVVAEDPIVEPDPEPTGDPEPIVEPDPEPTTPSVHSIIQQLFSSFVNSLFGSMSRLFGR